MSEEQHERSGPRKSKGREGAQPAVSLADVEVLQRYNEAARRRSREMGRMAEASGARSVPVVDESLQTLDLTLEELGVAEEELRQQNEVLIEAREAIEAERARYQELFEAAPDAYVVTDSLGVVRAANRAALRMLRTSPGFAIGKPFVIFVSPDDRRRLRAHLTGLAGGGAPESLELHLRSRIGEEIAADLRVTAVRSGPRGQVEELRWIARDVTERRRAEARIRVVNEELEARVAERTQELQAALRLADELLAQERAARENATRADERVAFLSAAGALFNERLDVRATLGVAARLAVPRLGDVCAIVTAATEASPRQVTVAYADPAHQAAADLLREALERGDDDICGIRRVLRSGECSTAADLAVANGGRTKTRERVLSAAVREAGLVAWHARPLEAHGHAVGAVLFATMEGTDTSRLDPVLAEGYARRVALAFDNARLYAEVAAAREREAEVSRLKSELFAMLSHELRTPMQAIGGYTELLQLGVHGALEPAQQEVMSRIRLSHDLVLRLVSEVLDYARLEHGAPVVTASRVSLREALADVGAIVEPQLAARRIRYELAGGPDVLVHADRQRLRQIVLNLLGNAAKYATPGAEVRLDWELAGAEALIRVRDTGPGIPEDKLEAIFAPFVQLPDPKGSVSGVGLGLAISRQFARTMGGDLHAESGPGEGATFVLSLPRVLDEGTPTSGPAPRQED